MRKLFYFPFLILMTFISCSDTESPSLQIPKNAIAMKSGGGELVLVKDFTKTKKELISFMVNDFGVFKDMAVVNEDVEMINFSIEKSSTGRAYMIYKLQAGGKAVSVAHEIIEAEGGYYTTMGETHTCAGDNCSSCEFVKDENGNITGCDCASVGGSCNHTVSTKDPSLSE